MHGINNQRRLCFKWTAAGPEQVEIVDDHRRGDIMVKNGMRPIHTGEILREDFLKRLDMSAHALAVALRVPGPRINDIVARAPLHHARCRDASGTILLSIVMLPLLQ
jgi:hypothetical protein